MKFLMIASFPDSLLTFRGPLLKALADRGFELHVASPGLAEDSLQRKRLEDIGIHVHQIKLQRTGMSPLQDVHTIFSLCSLMKDIRPDYVFSYTIKPVIYGMISAWMMGVPKRFALVTGLGYAFENNADGHGGTFLQKLVRKLYTLALSNTHLVFFQNPDDERLFRNLGLFSKATRSCVVNGSGIPLEQFEVASLPSEPRFLMIARLLGDKGVREYFAAAKQLKSLYPAAVFQLVGWIDENPTAIAQSELYAWIDSGVIEYLGRLSDVRPAIGNCNVYVLPSYREGTPRTVLEAMAMGRAIITTDAPGCKETVVDGENGFLVPVKSVDSLALAMEKFIVDPTLAIRMGHQSRKVAVEKYDVRKVNDVMLKEMGI